ncbi:hypothetical protein LCM16_08990 [Mameliella alba]|nr:hypothetical protein [Mameliella alba]
MPIEFTIFPDRSLALFRMFGVIDVSQGFTSFRDYVQHRDFSPDFIMLSDTRRVLGVDASFLGIVASVQRAHGLLQRYQDTGGLSVIHAPNDVTFGVARIMQQVTEPVSNLRFEILRDESEALAASGQPETGFDALDSALAPRQNVG